MPRRKRQTQKQRQSQTQKVIIHLDGKHIKEKAKKRRRRPRQPREPIQIQPTQLPPNVIYQSHQITGLPIQPEAVPLKESKITTTTSPKDFADVGVGTEGFVRILEKPTKEETLSVLTEPVSLMPTPRRTRRTKKEMSEARQMEREDIASINLGLTQFNLDIPEKFVEEENRKQAAIMGQQKMVDFFRAAPERRAFKFERPRETLTEGLTTSTEPLY